MGLIHEILSVSAYDFYQLDGDTSDYVFIDEKSSPKKTAYFIDTAKLRDLDYRKRLCSKEGFKKIETFEENSTSKFPEKTIVTKNGEEYVLQFRKKYIKYYNQEYDFKDLGKFSLEEILSNPSPGDQNIAESIALTLDKSNYKELQEKLVHGIKLLPGDWKEKFYRGDEELKPVSIPSSKDKETLYKIAQYNHKLKSRIEEKSRNNINKPTKNIDKKRKKVLEKFQKMRMYNFRKYFKDLAKIQNKLHAITEEYNSKINAINQNIPIHSERFNTIDIQNIDLNNLDDIIKRCVSTEEDTSDQ